MKFSATLLVLAAVASQALAVVPVPVKGCQKTVQVKPTDTGCDQFASDNHITFKQLLAWNLKLSPKCDNLDVDAFLCVVGPKKPVPATTQKPKPKPTTHKPKPTTHKPKPTTHKPKPITHKPKPTTHKPKPSTHKPKPTPYRL
ncbi:hypothetical protein BGZ83_002616 [Gryganskiella cystojenkinii]|nr:hypothetical protein BGZ83_002616 [Gryganskiella cystojenkinii]